MDERTKNCGICSQTSDRYTTITSFTPDHKVKDERIECDKCYHAELVEDYIKTSHLTTRMVTEASFFRPRGYPEPYQSRSWLNYRLATRINAEIDLIYAEIERFQAEIWKKIHYAEVKLCKMKGMSGETRGVKVLSWACAARIVLTIEDDKSSVSVIGAEDEPDSKFGLQGIQATGEAAVNLLKKVIATWPKMKSDEKVGMF